MSSQTPVVKRGSLVALIACVVLSGLAAGAIWCLLSLFTDHDTTFLLVAFAFAIAWFMRWQGFADRRGAIGAVGAVAIAIVYSQYLFAAMRMADLLGFPLRDTLFKMDVPFAWRIVKSHLDVWDIAIFFLACAIAAWTTARRKKI